MRRASGTDGGDPTARIADPREAEAGQTLADDATRHEPARSSRSGGPRPELGDVVAPDRYELGSEIARGGIGRILRAHDRKLGRTVALKELRVNDGSSARRFLREIRITAELQHPNIVPLHDAGRWPNGQPFYAMKLVDGRTLARALEEAMGLTARLALIPVLVDAAEAMAYAHHLGIVHRDLKPANVLVGPFGETVVIDWGLAKHVDEPDEVVADRPPPSGSSAYETSPGSIVGTPAYMPPEQAGGGAVDRTADVYALGAMLYHVVLGRSPYAGEDETAVLARVREAGPTPLLDAVPDAPRDLAAIVDKAMERDPIRRYPTAREMAAELRAYTSGGLVGAYRYGLWELAARFFERRRAVVLTGLAALLALGFFAMVSVARIAEERDRARTSAAAEGRARADAEIRVDELLVEKARALLDRDPTESVAWLKRPKTVPVGAATIAAWAEERGVAERVLRGHGGPATTVAYSPDGRLLVTGGDDKGVVLWNGADGTAKELVGHADRVTRVAVDPTGNVIASASYDTTIRLWTSSGQLVRILGGHRAPVKSIAFSSDGHSLCSIATDGETRAWNVAGGAHQAWSGAADRDLFCAFSRAGDWLLSGSHGGELRLVGPSSGAVKTLIGHRGPVRGAAFSPDGASVVSGGEDGSVRIWDVATGQGKVLGQGDAMVLQVAFAPGGDRVASADMVGAVKLWALDGKAPRLVSSHGERVAAIAFSDDGRYLASSGWDKLIRVANLRTQASTVLRGHADVVAALAFSPEGPRLASASWDKTIRLWSAHHTHERRVLRGHTVGVRTVAYSPDARLVASGGHDNAVRVWNPETGESRLLSGHTDHVYRVVFSPDGKQLASSSDDRTVRLWSVSGDVVRVLEGHRDDVEELAYSPDGSRLVSTSEDATARLWPTSDGPSVVLEHDHDVTGAAFDRGGRLLATASRDHTVRLWDGRSGAARRTLRGHEDEVWGLAFSPDGGSLASASSDDTVIVWDPSGLRRATFRGLSGARLVAFSPDGRRIAVAGAAPKLWLCDVARASCTGLTGHTAIVHDLAFLPDGRALATASGDGTVQVWDLDTNERRVLEGHAAPVFDLALSPDGNRFCSASGDGDVRLWAVVRPPRPSELGAYLDGLSREQLAPGMGSPALSE